MKVSYRRQVPVEGVRYSAEEVVFEDDVDPAKVGQWVAHARAIARQGFSDWKGEQPANIKTSADGPDPEGKPTGDQRSRIRRLMEQCAIKGVDIEDLAGPKSFAEAEALIGVLRQRLGTTAKRP